MGSGKIARQIFGTSYSESNPQSYQPAVTRGDLITYDDLLTASLPAPQPILLKYKTGVIPASVWKTMLTSPVVLLAGSATEYYVPTAFAFSLPSFGIPPVSNMYVRTASQAPGNGAFMYGIIAPGNQSAFYCWTSALAQDQPLYPFGTPGQDIVLMADADESGVIMTNDTPYVLYYHAISTSIEPVF